MSALTPKVRAIFLLAALTFGCSADFEPCWLQLTQGNLGGYIVKGTYNPPQNSLECGSVICQNDDKVVCTDEGEFGSVCELIHYMESSERYAINFRYGKCL